MTEMQFYLVNLASMVESKIHFDDRKDQSRGNYTYYEYAGCINDEDTNKTSFSYWIDHHAVSKIAWIFSEGCAKIIYSDF